MTSLFRRQLRFVGVVCVAAEAGVFLSRGVLGFVGDAQLGALARAVDAARRDSLLVVAAHVEVVADVELGHVVDACQHQHHADETDEQVHCNQSNSTCIIKQQKTLLKSSGDSTQYSTRL